MDKISLKTKEQIALMVKGGNELSRIRDLLVSEVKPGVRTIELDRLAESRILAFGGKPSFKTVRDYRYATCISVNDEVVHGIPSQRVIKEGDVVKVDLGMIYSGLHTDTTWTVLVHNKESRIKNLEVEKFLKIGEETLAGAIKITKPGGRIGKISQIIEAKIKSAGYFPVEILTGHGVGLSLHEDPVIPQVLLGKVEETPEIVPGMTLAIEVIYNLGTKEVLLKKDSWTIASVDGKISATFEKSIAVEKNGSIVLTP